MANEKRIEEKTLKELREKLLHTSSSQEREELIRSVLLYLFNEEDFGDLLSVAKKISRELDEGW